MTTQDLNRKIENAFIDGLVKLFGQVIHRDTITQADLMNRFMARDQETSSIPVIDVRMARHIKLRHPFDQETIAQLQSVGYCDETITMIGESCRAEEEYRLRLIAHNKGRVSDSELEAAFGAQFIPLTHIPLDALAQPCITDCDELPPVRSIATHMPPLSLDLLQTQSYIEACVKNLCEGVTVTAKTRVYYDFFLDKNKLYLFVSFQS